MKIQSADKELLQGEMSELQNKYDGLRIDFNRVENEKNEAVRQLKECGSLSSASAKDMFAELWRRFLTSLDRKA